MPEPTDEPGYEPVPIADLCNAGVEAVGGQPPIGDVRLRGLPFLIGPVAERCFLILGGDQAPTGEATIAVDRGARWVIFAHRLLSTRVLAGGPVGLPAAEYRFVMADGSSHTVPIRERFEIGWPLVGTRAGGKRQLPALALPDNLPQLPPRLVARFGRPGAAHGGPVASRRPTELNEAMTSYFLWAWQNPDPDMPVQRIVVAACGLPVLIAGVTLGHLDEYPLAPSAGAVPVRVDLADVADLRQDLDVFDLEVAVDRGVATFPYPLDPGGAEEFLRGKVKGWGEPAAARCSPAYVTIAAVPSATVTVRLDGTTVGRASWGELLDTGRAEAGTARLRVVEPGRNWVKTTVVDADTGRPVPCRIHFRSPDGVPYQPYGHHAHVGGGLDTWGARAGGDVRLGGISYAYIDGRCEGWLPRGEVLVDVACGFEYEPLRTRLRVDDAQRALRLELRRWRDMNAEGWYSGDTHVHFLSTVGSQLEARGEGLNVVNLLATQWGHLFTGIEEFTGRPLVTPDGRTVTHVSQESRQHFLGHLSLLGLSEPVLPWCSDGPFEAELGGTLEVTLSELADRCHAQGGTVVLPHMTIPNGEVAALVATGRLDAMEMVEHLHYAHTEYYRYLNGGYRMPLVGGTDKMSAEVPVGLMRTYVRIPDEEFSYAAWRRNLTAGRTFVSSGPLLTLSVDGAEVGDTVRLPSGGGEVEVEARAESALPIHCLQLVLGGEVVDASESASGVRQLTLRARLRVTENTWIAARVSGPGYERPLRHNDVWERGVMAHTSPVYVACGEAGWTAFDDDSIRYMLSLVDMSRTYIRALGLQHPPGRALHHHGDHDHLDHLDAPLRQARHELARRLTERR